MDKYLIKNASKVAKFDSLDIFPIIRDCSKNRDANQIINEWIITKYDKNIARLCRCNITNYFIYLENKYNKNLISICDQCAKYLNINKNICENINEIAEGILAKRYKKITPALREFLNLDKAMVEKYNTKVSKRSRKMYEMLLKIIEYHYKYQQLKAELDKTYSKMIISKELLLDRVIEKLKQIMEKLESNICDDCKKSDNFSKCYDCFVENNDLDYLIEEQKEALYKVYSNIFSSKENKFGLFGSAGTGKTTLIKYIIQITDIEELLLLRELLRALNIIGITKDEIRDQNEDAIRKKVKEKIAVVCEENGRKGMKRILDILNNKKHIILASPTNKALDVIREKVIAIGEFQLMDNKNGFYKNLKITFDTISRLLTYHRFYDKNHNLIFKRGNKFANIMDKYNLIIIDESSMICKENMTDIIADIENALDSKGIILFTGDRCQLPPPKEKFSAIFRVKMETVDLEKVVRTNKERIHDLSTLVRKWIDTYIPQTQKNIMANECEYIRFYSDEDSFIDAYMKYNDAIILVWTNETRMRYNKMIRNIMFANSNDNRHKKEKFMINEHLIFNNFYKLKVGSDEKCFYSSMPVVVAGISIREEYICYKFTIETVMEKIDNICENDNKARELIEIIDYTEIKKYMLTFVNRFNNSMNNVFKIWELMFTNKGVLQEVPMLVIYDKKKYAKDIENGKKYIKEYFDAGTIGDFTLNEFLRDVIIELFDVYYQQPFADIDYGYAMTVDKSQGSTYSSVFIDAADILDQERYPFLDIETAKKRFYTGITRAADEVNILF